MSGWKFDNLHITVWQRLCEALHAVGRKKDAGEFLLEMVNTLDEEIYSSKPITKWVSGEIRYLNNLPVSNAFKIFLQTLSNNVSPLPKVIAMRSRCRLET